MNSLGYFELKKKETWKSLIIWDLGFLEHVLEMKGFLWRWRKWLEIVWGWVIFVCLGKVGNLVLLEAMRSSFSWLFTWLVYILSRLLERARECGVGECISTARDGLEVSFLQFLIYTFFFYLERWVYQRALFTLTG